MTKQETNEPLLFPDDIDKPFKDQLSFFSGQILLNPKITKINFFCYLMYTAFLGVILLPIGLYQASVLGVIYGLKDDEQAYMTSTVQLAQVILQFIASPWIGYLCDKFGRKPLVCLGLFGLCTSILLTPNLPSPYPYYIINQSLQGLSLTFMMIPPLLADYIDKSTHGRMSGLASVIINAGSFTMTCLNTNHEETEQDLRKKFFYIGVIASVLALLIISGLKGGSYHKEVPQKINLIQQCTSLNEDNEDTTVRPTSHAETQPGLIAGIKEARNPWIFLGYLINFLMLSSVGLTSFCLVKYVTHLVNDDKKFYLAYALVNKFLLSATICSIFFGFFADKFNKFKLIVFTVLCSLTSITLLILMKSPTEPIAYISMVFFGTASAGFITMSTQLLNKYASPQFRGSVVAVGAMVSVLATALINILGVYLLHWNVLIPFFMYFGFAIASLLILIVLYISKKDILNQT